MYVHSTTLPTSSKTGRAVPSQALPAPLWGDQGAPWAWRPHNLGFGRKTLGPPVGELVPAQRHVMVAAFPEPMGSEHRQLLQKVLVKLSKAILNRTCCVHQYWASAPSHLCSPSAHNCRSLCHCVTLKALTASVLGQEGGSSRLLEQQQACNGDRLRPACLLLHHLPPHPLANATVLTRRGETGSYPRMSGIAPTSGGDALGGGQ